MQRRQVLASLALVAGATAGCSQAPAPEPAPPEETPPNAGDGIYPTIDGPLEIADEYTVNEDRRGNVQIELTVRNPDDVQHVATLWATAILDGRTTKEQTLFDLAAGDSATRTITFGFAYDAWQQGVSSITFECNYLPTDS